MKDKKTLRGWGYSTFLAASLFMFGALIVIDFTMQPQHAGVGGAIKGFAKGFISKAIGLDKAKRTWQTAKGLSSCFMQLVSKFAAGATKMGFYEKDLYIKVPLLLPAGKAKTEQEIVEDLDEGDYEEGGEGEEGEEYEGDYEEDEELDHDEVEEEMEDEASGGGFAAHSVGVYWDLGIVGPGIGETYKPVEALFVYGSPVSVEGLGVEGDEMPVYAARLIDSIESMLSRWQPLLAILTFGIGSLIIEGIKQILDGMSSLLRFGPSAVFRFKTLTLLRSAQLGKENLNYSHVLPNLVQMFAAFADSTNVKESQKLLANQGIDNPRKFTKKVTFKQTGIGDVFDSKVLKNLGKAIPVIPAVFNAIKVGVSEHIKTEYEERRTQTEPTKLEIEYSNMRTQKGFLTKTLYFQEKILPLLDTETFDKTDAEKFVRTTVVHAARRHLVMQELLGVNLLETLPDTGTILEADAVEFEKKTLSNVKASLDWSYPTLIEMLESSHQKMEGKSPFTENHRKKVASLLAKVRAEKEELDKDLEEVTWAPELPAGKTFDDYGNNANFSSLLKVAPTKIFNNSFLEAIREAASQPDTGTDVTPFVPPETEGDVEESEGDEPEGDEEEEGGEREDDEEEGGEEDEEEEDEGGELDE